MLTTGLLHDPRFLIHDAGPGHPEQPARLSASLEYLQTLPWFQELEQIKPRAAEEDWVAEIHSWEYMKRAKTSCREGRTHLDTQDVGICEASYDTAMLAAGGALELADAVMAGSVKNGFAMLRPPGHHAEEDFAMGFCLFNNAAILARYLQKKHGLEKILILDWDVHHGNGTQHAFYEDPSVFYASLHQFPFYPGTGAILEKGIGRGKGTTLNCPMPAGSGDKEYEEAFQKKIFPAVESFKPDAMILSAGFDAHTKDPLAGINLTTEFFGWMTGCVMEMAERHSEKRIISLLEGGYNLEHLPQSIAAHLAVLAGKE